MRGITDGQSGYRALSPAATAAAEVIHDFNYAQVLTLDLLAKGFRYAEVPITYAFREHGRSFVRLGPLPARGRPRGVARAPLRPSRGIEPRYANDDQAFIDAISLDSE